MALNGIDLADFQATLDLSNISYSFAGIKATEGTGYVNPSCDTHYQEAKAAGKKRMVYHYGRPDFNDPVSEANYFVDNCIGYIHEAIFALDWEGPLVGNIGWALQFLQQVEKRIGYKPAIYMSEWVENNYDWSAVVAGGYGLWAAKYSDYEIDNNYDMSNAGQPPNVVHWPLYFMWQWTSVGHLNGYAGNLDCDIFYGDETAWDKYAGVPEVAPTTTTTTTIAPTTTTTTTMPPITTTTTTSTTVAPTTTTTTTIVPPEPQKTWLQIVVAVIIAIIKRLQGKAN